jgi:hypothetical protein
MKSEREMTKEEYYQLIKGIRAELASDGCRECSCPKTHCEWHGDCYACVRLHRIHGDHVPNCLQAIMDKKVAAIAAVTEMTVQKKPQTPAEYWDYVRQKDAEEAAHPTHAGDGSTRAR